jgi:hypothetical protein
MAAPFGRPETIRQISPNLALKPGNVHIPSTHRLGLDAEPVNPNGKATAAGSRQGEPHVRNGEGNRRHTRFSDATRSLSVIDHMDLNVRHFFHSKHLVVMKLALHDTASIQCDVTAKGGRQARHNRPDHRCINDSRMDDLTTIGTANNPEDTDTAALDRNFGNLLDDRSLVIHGRDARSSDRFSVQMDRARATFSDPTTKLGPRQTDNVPDCPQQRHVRIDIDRVIPPVYRPCQFRPSAPFCVNEMKVPRFYHSGAPLFGFTRIHKPGPK